MIPTAFVAACVFSNGGELFETMEGAMDFAELLSRSRAFREYENTGSFRNIDLVSRNRSQTLAGKVHCNKPWRTS